MLQLKNMFHGVKTLLSKYNKSKKQETRDKYYNEIKTKLDTQQVDKVFKEDLKRQKQEQKQRKQLQKKLDAAVKRQGKLEKERARQDKKLEKITREQTLSSRLLSEGERNNLLIQKYNQALTRDKLKEINKKLRDDKLEQARRNKFGHGNLSARMRKLAEKFRNMNDKVGNVYTEMNDQTTQRGGILVRDIFMRRQREPSFGYFLNGVEPTALSILKGFSTSKKVQLKIHFTMVKYSLLRNQVIERVEKIFSTKLSEMFHTTDLKELYETLKNDLIDKWLNVMNKGSGWELESIEKVQVWIYNYTPFSSHKNNDGNVNVSENERATGGKDKSFDMGKFWRGKEGMISPQNKSDDENCFLYACQIALEKPEKNPGRITRQLKKDIQKFNIEGVNLPPSKKDIIKFEKNNNIKILALCAQTDGEHVEIYKPCINPDLMIMLMKNPKGQSHWCAIPCISSLSRLVSSNISKSKRARFICTNCIHFNCRTESKLKEHYKYCLQHEAQITHLPTKKDIIQFKNHSKESKPPISTFSDFECFQPKVNFRRGGVSEIITLHHPSGCGIYVKSEYEDRFPSRYIKIRAKDKNDDIPKMYIQELIKIRDELAAIPACDIFMTKNDEINFKQATSCYMCKEAFTEEDWKVRDHNHHTGAYRGAAHNSCNLKFKEQKFIPNFIHNLKGYDAHIFLKAFRDLEEHPEIIPQNEEKFISFSLKKKEGVELRFLDTMGFFNNTSLSVLAGYLKDKPIMRKVFGDRMAKDLDRKGVFPYEWFDNLEKLGQKEFPSFGEFRSVLSGLEAVDDDGWEEKVGKNITEDDYNYAKKIYVKYCKDFGDYHDLYMKVDVILLADVFEEFGNMCYDYFGLHPGNYYTVPGFSWDCLLKYSGAKLEPLTMKDMYIFLERGIRGGYSNIHKRYSKANHKYLPDYDKSKVSKFLIYWDFNSMYAYAMTKKMPYSDFRWATEEQIKEIEHLIKNGAYDDIPPCTLSVDLSHDEKNRDKEAIFTMCPEVVEVEGVKKLCHNLNDKEDYVVHHRIFKKYLKEGMIVKKVNRVLLYKEKAWMKSYIEFCVEERRKADLAGNEFLKEFWKLMCNAVFGKSMENVRNRVNFKLVNSHKQLQKEMNKPTFKEAYTYHPGLLVGVKFSKTAIKLDKPIYTGQCILDESKLMMYEFLYDYVFPKWGVDNVRVCMTDTDSVLLEIKTDDLYKDFAEDVPKWFDTQKYHRTQYGETSIPKMNLKKLGMMKDELCGDFILEFAGTAPKNYGYSALKTQKDKSIKLGEDVRCKGIGKKFTPRFQEYKDCVLGKEGDTVYKECFRINSKKHELFTIKTNKVAMRNTVVKRLPNPNQDDDDIKFETLPLGW